MGVYGYEAEFNSVLPSARLLKAFLDANNLIPKAVPKIVESVKIIKGEGGPGSILLITYAEGRPFKEAKHRIDDIDSDNMKYSYTVIEGGPLGDRLEKISTDIKIVAAPVAESSLKITSAYYTKDNGVMNDEEFKPAKEQAERLFRAVEVYLIEHSDEYN